MTNVFWSFGLCGRPLCRIQSPHPYLALRCIHNFSFGYIKIATLFLFLSPLNTSLSFSTKKSAVIIFVGVSQTLPSSIILLAKYCCSRSISLGKARKNNVHYWKIYTNIVKITPLSPPNEFFCLDFNIFTTFFYFQMPSPSSYLFEKI